jgi:hypothetical protein
VGQYVFKFWNEIWFFGFPNLPKFDDCEKVDSKKTITRHRKPLLYEKKKKRTATNSPENVFQTHLSCHIFVFGKKSFTHTFSA